MHDSLQRKPKARYSAVRNVLVTEQPSSADSQFLTKVSKFLNRSSDPRHVLQIPKKLYVTQQCLPSHLNCVATLSCEIQKFQRWLTFTHTIKINLFLLKLNKTKQYLDNKRYQNITVMIYLILVQLPDSITDTFFWQFSSWPENFSFYDTVYLFTCAQKPTKWPA